MAHELTEKDYAWLHGWIKKAMYGLGIRARDREDTMQDVFVSVVKLANSFGDEPSHEGYDFRALAWSTVRYAIMRSRANRCKPWRKNQPAVFSVDSLIEQDDGEVGYLGCDDDAPVRVAVREVVESVLSRIGRNERALIDEYLSEDTLAMIGARRGISKSRAHQLIRRAVHEARKIARELYGEEAVSWKDEGAEKTKIRAVRQRECRSFAALKS
jgi:RNA polymerase sigma factor (sigma-70 family)